MPGVRTAQQWRDHCDSVSSPVDGEPTFACLHLPSRQRRRLSALSKSALDVALGVLGENLMVPVVFASRRGEVGRMVSLLQDICGESEASPTAFSLSVHNTATGLLSINSSNTLPSTAIAAGHDTVISALTEACTQLACGAENVLLIIAEDQLPELYSSFGSVGESPVAAAFMLTAGNEFQFQTKPNHTPRKNHDDNRTLLPGERYTSTAGQVELFIKALVTKSTTTMEGERLLCTLQPI